MHFAISESVGLRGKLWAFGNRERPSDIYEVCHFFFDGTTDETLERSGQESIFLFEFRFWRSI